MRIFNVVLGLGLLLGAGNAFAEDEKSKGAAASDAVEKAHEDVKEETREAAKEAGVKGSNSGGSAKYGPAGCGLGSLIFSPDSGWTQIFAATTNGTSANQTFGITSGTSNCDTGPSKESAKNFVQANRSQLAKDISRGKGATLSSLSELAGCSDSKAVGLKLRKNFKVIFPNAQVESETVSESVVNVLKSDSSLSCSNLG
jgi:hypothetical protein